MVGIELGFFFYTYKILSTVGYIVSNGNINERKVNNSINFTSAALLYIIVSFVFSACHYSAVSG